MSLPFSAARLRQLAALLLLASLPLTPVYADDDGDDDEYDDDHGSHYSQCTPGTTPGITASTYRLSAMPSGHRAIKEGEAMPAGHPRTAYGGAGTVFTLAAFPDATLVSAGSGSTTATASTTSRPSYRQGRLQLPEIALDDDPAQRFAIDLEWVPGSQPPLFRLKRATHLGQ